MRKTFPDKEDAFYNQQSLIIKMVEEDPEKYGIPKKWFQEKVLPLRDKWEAKRALCNDPSTRTTPAVKAKREARKAFQKIMGQVILIIKNNPDVPQVKLDDAGIAYNKGGGNWRKRAREDFPHTHTDVSLLRRVLIYFYVFESMSRAKPSYVLGAEIRYAILDRQPADVSELTQSMFEPHSPFVLWFDDLERGKTLYYCVRWESTSGEKGPWSKIMDVMVP